jgi:type III restriction enzyme
VIWCDNATLLTGTPWQYLKVPQPEWRKLQPVDLADVRLAFAPPQLAGT